MLQMTGSFSILSNCAFQTILLTNQLLLFSLYSHYCDASFRELLRERFSYLFRRDIKLEVIGQSSHKKLTDEQPRGLFGGKGFILIFAC